MPLFNYMHIQNSDRARKRGGRRSLSTRAAEEGSESVGDTYKSNLVFEGFSNHPGTLLFFQIWS